MRRKGTLTVKLCTDTCKSRGFLYAGVQAGFYCSCGNSFGRHGACEPSTCQVSCQGNKEEMCGGHYRQDIYYLGV